VPVTSSDSSRKRQRRTHDLLYAFFTGYIGYTLDFNHGHRFRKR